MAKRRYQQGNDGQSSQSKYNQNSYNRNNGGWQGGDTNYFCCKKKSIKGMIGQYGKKTFRK